jgi:hypothetical protein
VGSGGWIVTKLVKAAPAVALLFALGTASAMAAPIPVLPLPQESAYHLAAEKKGSASSKVETTKTWLKTKTSQTTRWMGRQKQKIKRLVD